VGGLEANRINRSFPAYCESGNYLEPLADEVSGTGNVVSDMGNFVSEAGKTVSESGKTILQPGNLVKLKGLGQNALPTVFYLRSRWENLFT
jgi:hypothetical protein